MAKPIPEGYRSVTPYLTLKGAAQAIDFYTRAFGAQEPELVPGVLVVADIRPDVEVGAVLTPWHECARGRVRQGPGSELPEVAAWRRAYARIGLKPTQYRSAAEALLRRLRRQGGVPCLHPLVDLCNAVSVAFALPVAVFDVARIAGYLEVCHAAGAEQHVGVRGDESPEAGKVILDGMGLPSLDVGTASYYIQPTG